MEEQIMKKILFALFTLSALSCVKDHPMTTLALQGFDTDWKNVYGSKKPLDMA